MTDLCTCGSSNGCLIHTDSLRQATFALTADKETWAHIAQYFEEEAEGMDESSGDKLNIARQIRNKLKRVGVRR